MRLASLDDDRPRTWTEEEFQARQEEIIAEGERMRGASWAERFALLPVAQQEEIFESIGPLEWLRLKHDWRFWGRPKQLVGLEPSRFDTTIWIAGRGFGKSRTGSETIADRIQSGKAKSVCFIGATWEDVRRLMVGGMPDTDSGLLDVLPPWYPRDSVEGVIFNQNKKEITIGRHGCTVYLNSGENKEQRGGNFDHVWIDEPIKFRYLDEVLMNLDMALRKGAPEMFITTTPKPQDWLREMIMDPTTRVVHGVTTENRNNVPQRFLAKLARKYGGTRIALQEMGARILGDNDRALAKMTQIDKLRLSAPADLTEVGVGVDPAVSTKRKSDDSGIVAAGRGADGHLYLLEDITDRYSADDWPRAAVKLCIEWGGKFIIYERNKIGDTGASLIKRAISDAGMKDKIETREAYSMNDKWTRAFQSLSPLYERGEAHHVGRHPDLESQLTQWEPKEGQPSPNNLDAYVHVAVELMGLAKIDEPKKSPAERFRGFEAMNREFQRPGYDPFSIGSGGSGRVI